MNSLNLVPPCSFEDSSWLSIEFLQHAIPGHDRGGICDSFNAIVLKYCQTEHFTICFDGNQPIPARALNVLLKKKTKKKNIQSGLECLLPMDFQVLGI